MVASRIAIKLITILTRFLGNNLVYKAGVFLASERVFLAAILDF